MFDDLSFKLLRRKGSAWVDKTADISDVYCHELIILMWVHHILKTHWSDSSAKKNDIKVKKDIVCSFEKKVDDADIRMNHRDDTFWTYILHV